MRSEAWMSSTSAKSVQKKKTPECRTRQIDAQAHKMSLEHLPFPPGFARTLGHRRPHAWPSPAPADGRDGAISCSDPANDCWEEYLATVEEAEEADRPILPHPRVAVSPRSRGAPCAGCPALGRFAVLDFSCGRQPRVRNRHKMIHNSGKTPASPHVRVTDKNPLDRLGGSKVSW